MKFRVTRLKCIKFDKKLMKFYIIKYEINKKECFMMKEN